MEPPGAGPAAVFINFDFGPSLGLEIECPEVLHVCEALPSEHHEVGVAELCNMVGSLPRSGFILPGDDLPPLLGLPVQDRY